MALIAPYDPNRFTSAIPHYINGRPAYAERLVAWLARETGLNARSRVLDLGCGPGSLTLPLSRFGGTTLGIDADASMISAARQAAEIAGADIDWRVGSSFDLGADLAPLDLITIARAFHWMDREAALKRFDEIVAPGGAVALVNTELHAWGSTLWHAPFE
jgi:2-polyprenyl-3-methyl-5-hydroxy-6-metoxy-1,4-benzoquinol methylase